MEYVIAQLVLLAAALVTLYWWRRKHAWRVACDVEAEEAVRYFRAVAAMPEVPEVIRDMNRAIALAARYSEPDRALARFGGVPIFASEKVPGGVAFIGQHLIGHTAEFMVMRPEHVAVITGIT